ncbi:3,4-dihydroxy-2-butanone-4-phosphate synthase [Allofrancisella guangzhouensis]|uniref:3,4-dihydroxy-2-butanone 4-phosphate synthase n=1 Tax=Allofrancisella guangzhouensis TaxID=594679 RepID=A0A0A8E3Z7_9GAMM|nr:3,4-dihydroxy-2-butanone-4-phosphate synthase [Allofrancisella guangzhouensis]AJC48337.1 3,4-dihydroxy-2-butanone 4-phosphate synthase [Allofrancisella guangzhouensis]MBK2026573.1 3,4-dihydroxy-2-butanone-4-phosphate synthase [Allofrancisella guangzhouensis]MBK2044317.1 3,4-dihydroxy-2-butanone-4-phosphate synthase [Allofrancisella guangzhouensis]MBK2045560.1 3,4-dihydroxy-2-butanone-4-phosphate synthase [Allofrancisella guangzhouensis]
MFNQIKNNVVKAIQALKSGKPIVVLDDYDRENEGDLILPGQMATEQNIAFMLEHTSGIVCLAMDSKQAKRLNLTPMVAADQNNSTFSTPFTVTIEAKEGVTTGVSAKDRAHTIQVASSYNAKAEDLARPGHIFPLIANDKGVLGRNGHTEASVDLMKLSGFNSVGVLCELMNKDGTMMKAEELETFAQKYNLPILTIAELYQYRLATEIFVEKTASSSMPFVNVGELEMSVYKDIFSNDEVVVLSKPYHVDKPLVRMHSSCITGDLFGSLRCDCQAQLKKAMQMINEEGGYLIYLNQEGRGIGLTNKLKAYNLQMRDNMDTIEANIALGLPVDARKYDLAIQVLKYNKIDKCRLISNNPKKVNALRMADIATEPVACEAFVNSHNKGYLITKKNKMKHTIKGI